ncbi:MAG: hypothetical protein IJ071_05360 [Ruminococcus sp.]|nr:hypothetical protein [Ruminococcus sp.]
MMRRIISLAAAVLLSLMLMPMFSLTAGAAENYAQGWSGDAGRSMIEDDYGLFDEATLNDLNKIVRETAEKLEMNIYIFLAGTGYRYQSDSQTVIFADDSYDEIFGEDTDGVFYYLDISGKSPACDHISTSGKAVLWYQNDIDTIFSRLDAYLPASGETVYSDDIARAIRAYLGFLESYQDTSSGLRYYHDESSGKYFYYVGSRFYVSKSRPPAISLLYGAASAVAGLVVSLIVYFVTKSKYKFKSSTDAGVYVSREHTRYFQNEDTFLREHTSRVRIESSGGGGGGYRGGGGGGHSYSGGHGGGSHHR